MVEKKKEPFMNTPKANTCYCRSNVPSIKDNELCSLCHGKIEIKEIVEKEKKNGK